MMKHWENENYQRIIDTKFAKGLVTIKFANGDIVKLPIENLLPPGFESGNLEKINFNEFEIIIPGTPENLEVPWDKVRVISDSEFSKFLASQAAEQAREVGLRIKKLREKKGLKSGELAGRSGLTPQTITRIEKGYNDVSFITLRKILAAMGYSLKDLANEESYEDSPEKKLSTLLRKLSKLGIDSNFILNRVVPSNIGNALKEHKGKEPEMLLDELTGYLSTIYGWTSREIWEDESLDYKEELAEYALYKKPANANTNQVRAYSHYAFYIARTILKACATTETKPYPGDTEEFKNILNQNYNGLELESILSLSWDLGICVIPLNDPGIFHGASWNIDGKHVIILKQNTNHHAKWVYNLLHELYHVFDHLSKPNSSIIEFEEIGPFSNNDSMEEREANSFANLVLFDSHAEDWAQEAVKLANWKTEGLKVAVQKIAKEKNIRVDFLANYIAYRLSFNGQNWWGTANNLQVTTPDPYTLCLLTLGKRIDTKKLTPVESNVLSMALTSTIN